MGYSLSSVIKGSTLYSIGKILIKGSGFLLIPVFTFYLTPKDYGVLGYVSAISQVLSTFLMLGFYGAQTRYYYQYKDNPDIIGEFLFTINVFLALVLLFVAVLLTYFGCYFDIIFNLGDIPYYPYIPVIVWSVVFQVMNQMVISYYIASKEYKKTVILQFYQFLLITGFSLYFVAVKDMGALGRLIGALIGQAGFFILFYSTYAKKFVLHLKKQYLFYALAFGIPVIFHLLGGTLMNVADQFILKEYVSIAELGVYSLGYQFGIIMSILVIAINQAWQPNYFDLMSSDKTLEDKKYEYRRYFSYWLFIIGTVCLAGMLFSKEIIWFMTPKSYFAAADIVPIILFAYLLQGIYFFVSSPIFFYKKTIFLPFLTLTSATINVCLNFLLIPSYGMYGAAYATVLAFVVQVILMYLVGKKYFNPNFEKKSIFILILLIIGIQISIFFSLTWTNFILKLLYLSLFIFIVYLMYRTTYFKKLQLLKIFKRKKI